MHYFIIIARVIFPAFLPLTQKYIMRIDNINDQGPLMFHAQDSPHRLDYIRLRGRQNKRR